MYEFPNFIHILIGYESKKSEFINYTDIWNKQMI